MKELKDKSKSVRKHTSGDMFLIDVIIFIISLILVYTGLLLQFEYHLGHHEDNYLIFNLDRAGWNLIHKIASVSLLFFLLIHLYFHIKWIKNNIIIRDKTKGKLNKNFRNTRNLIYFFSVTAFLGIFPWIFGGDDEEFRFHFIELHDKISFVLIVMLILHVCYHYKVLINYFKKFVKINKILAEFYIKSIRKLQI
jgi:hypothetical protein